MATRLFYHYGLDGLARPSEEACARLIKEAKGVVLASFAPGKRRKKEEVSEVLQCVFEFFSLRLDSLLRKLASREFMEFVLYQYDLAAKGWRQTPDEVTIEACRENSEFSTVRRGLKFLAERTAMRSAAPEFAPAGPPGLFRYVEESLFAARMLADLYMMSDRAYYIMPGEMELEVCGAGQKAEDEGWPLGFRLTHDKSCMEVDLNFSRRIVKDRSNREKYFPDHSLNFDFKRQAIVLDPAFEKSFGCPYSRFLHVLAMINEQARPAPGG